MTRLYIPGLGPDPQEIIPDKENIHYLSDVLRCGSGDTVVVFDGTGREFTCTVKKDQRSMILSVLSMSVSENIPLRNVVHLQGMLKGQKMDLVVQKLAELGVSRFIPVITERSQVRSSSKRSRWEKISLEASRQCRRTDVMKVSEPMDMDGVIDLLAEEYPEALKMVFYEGKGRDLSSFAETIGKAKELILFIGPEGGFPESEVTRLERSGFDPVLLGNLIMRAETAAITSAGLVQYIAGQFNAA